jgi:hypothetical protein
MVMTKGAKHQPEQQARPVPATQRLAGGAQLAFFVGEHNFHPTVLRPPALGSVGVHRVLVAVAFDLDALFVDPRSTSTSATDCARSRDSLRFSCSPPVLSV